MIFSFSFFFFLFLREGEGKGGLRKETMLTGRSRMELQSPRFCQGAGGGKGLSSSWEALLSPFKKCKRFNPDKTSQLQDSETVETPRNHECKVTPEYRQVKVC